MCVQHNVVGTHAQTYSCAPTAILNGVKEKGFGTEDLGSDLGSLPHQFCSHDTVPWVPFELGLFLHKSRISSAMKCTCN